MRPFTLLAVTSPAEPENSLNAMDGITFMLQNLAAATVFIANIRNYLITTNQCVIIIHIKYNIKIKSRTMNDTATYIRSLCPAADTSDAVASSPMPARY